MRDLPELNELIDRAKSIAGSDYKLAKMIGVPQSRLSNWRHGADTIPPADVALIAEVAGLDPVAWAMKAMVSKYQGTPKGDRLMHAVGKALRATGAALGSSGASAAVIYLTAGSGALALLLRAAAASYDVYYV